MTKDVRDRRVDGWVPIEDYGCLGDGRTIALVARDGRVDWWPLPTLDSPPVFAALLAPDDGGMLVLGPDEPFESERRYLPGTNVLETTFRTEGGEVRVVDAVTTGTGGRLPWSELSRRVEAVAGEVRLRWAVRPGRRFAALQPWVQRRGATHVIHVGDQHLAVMCFDIGPARAGRREVKGEVTVRAGHRGLLTVVATDGEPLFLPPRARLEARLDETAMRWQQWCRSELANDATWHEQVQRSALALKLLTHTPTGAIAAAGTTSLPERLGGPKNYDYRYAWVRDCALALDALIALGLNEEVHASVSWLLGSIRSYAPHLEVFYKLDGRVPDEQQTVDVPGYRHSLPVRSGNSARLQRQLGTYGHLFETLWKYARAGHLFDVATSRLVSDLADRCADQWLLPDNGIWELPEVRHYTVSKLGCWVALDRAVRLAELGQLHSGHVDRWATERDAVRAWIERHCWSRRLGSYTFYGGTDELDAASLLMGRAGYDRGERLAGTVAAVRSQLGRGPLVHRYSGMQDQEGAFVACSFWLAECLFLLGHSAQASALVQETVSVAANDLGLMSEQVDPLTGAQLGNTPQALSHLSHVNAVALIADQAAGQDDRRG